MIKLATGNGKTYVELSRNEFAILAKALPKDVADGSEISLDWLEKMLAAATSPTQLLNATRTQLETTLQVIKSLQTATPAS